MIRLDIDKLNGEVNLVKPKTNHTLSFIIALIVTIIGAMTIDPTLSHGLGYSIMSGVTVISYILNILIVAVMLKIMTNLGVPSSLKINNGAVSVKSMSITVQLREVSVSIDEHPKAMPRSLLSYYDEEDVVLLKIESPKTALFMGVKRKDYNDAFSTGNT